MMTVKFPHRTNRDGTIDSICPRCFATIGKSHWEIDLERMEADHMCYLMSLASLDEEEGKAPKGPQRIGSSQKVQPIRRVV